MSYTQPKELINLCKSGFIVSIYLPFLIHYLICSIFKNEMAGFQEFLFFSIDFRDYLVEKKIILCHDFNFYKLANQKI